MAYNNIWQLKRMRKSITRIEFLNDNPIFYRLYQLTYYDQRKSKNIIVDLKTSDVVKDCNSSFDNPVLLVRKRKRRIKMCVNYPMIDKAIVNGRQLDKVV